jgi:hypothetical protein
VHPDLGSDISQVPAEVLAHDDIDLVLGECA